MKAINAGDQLDADTEYPVFMDGKCVDCGGPLDAADDTGIRACTGTVDCHGEFKDNGDGTAIRTRDLGPNCHP